MVGKLKDFFKDLKFNADIQEGKGNSNIDLALKNGEKTQIIIEAKIPTNSKEFITQEKPNVKALWECVLYFMRLKEDEKIFIKHLIITDFSKFYIFEKEEIKKIANIKEVKEIYNNKQNNDEFYKALESTLNKQDLELNAYFLDLKEKNDEILLFKIFSKEFLFDDYNINDSNILNKKFYDELLYILGLQEKDEKIIKSTSKDSTLYNLIEKELISKNKSSDFDNIIRYIIIWLNRILFLKLIETNLKNFNENDEKAKFLSFLSFLSFEKIKDFSKLDYLFFEIFAKNFENRDKNSEFYFLPYLNSSLFTIKEDLENNLRIKELDNHSKLSYYKNTILKDTRTKKRLSGEISWLKYFLDFLNAFDFGTTDENEINENKELINSSVLGLVFEKLNGYKEGSFYTPNFITSYMCERSINQVVINKFNETLNIKASNLNELKEKLNAKEISKDERIKILNSIRICDPAVGSAHFLVSALNEMIKIHFDLRTFKHLSFEDYLKIANDEIIIKVNNKIFNYKRCDLNSSLQKLQIELFNLKKSIIENNLFGVDINPNSVEIARLRLWIELLKNSYYLDDNDEIHNLATLPNIDINIKCGNSLISRFGLKENLTLTIENKNLKKQIKDYKEIVSHYKETNEKLTKKEIEKKIDYLKSEFKSILSAWDLKAKYIKLLEAHIRKYDTEGLDNDMLFDKITQKKFNYNRDFGFNKIEKDDKFFASIGKLKIALSNYYDAIDAKGYENSIEWRYEFPEILDDNGEFIGFDLIIGNPPYISAPAQEANKLLSSQREAIVNSKRYKTLTQKWDLYIPFVELGIKELCKDNGICAMIIPYPYVTQKYAKLSRELITKEFNLFEISDLQGIKVFDSAVVTNAIIFVSKENFKDKVEISHINKDKIISQSLTRNLNELVQNKKDYVFNTSLENRNSNKHSVLNILGDFCYISVGMVLNSDEKTAKGEFEKDDLISEIKDKIHSREYIEAKDIEKYKINRTRYLEYNTERCPNKIRRKTFEELYDFEKINFNRLGNLKCVYDDKNLLHNESIITCVLWKNFKGLKNKSISSSIKRYCRLERSDMEKLSEGMNLKYILGICNSKYGQILLNNLRGDGNSFYPEHIRNLPIPKITDKNKSLADEIIKLVDIILKLKNRGENSQEFENKIDDLVYKLYNLTDDEIKLIKGEQ